MKKTTLVTTTAALVLAFGLSACSDVEMANMQKDMNQAAQNQASQNIIDAERDCKVYVANKTSLPMAAISVSSGNMYKGVSYIPVRVKWNEPYVDETGECKVVNGKTESYRIID